MRKRQLFKKRILALALSVSMVFASTDTYVVLAAETVAAEEIDSASQPNTFDDINPSNNSDTEGENGTSNDSDTVEDSDPASDPEQVKDDNEVNGNEGETDLTEDCEEDASSELLPESQSEEEAENSSDEIIAETGDVSDSDKADAIADGSSADSIVWSIESGKLSIVGTGDYEVDNNGNPPWAGRADVKSASVFRVSGITSTSKMLYRCINMTEFLSNRFDTSNVKNMSSMFNYCSSVESLDLSSFDTSNVENMSSMFSSCSSLKSLDLSNFNTSNVKDMSNMFSLCSSLESLDLSKFDTEGVTSMSRMFYNCKDLTSLDMSNFDTSNVTNMSAMFSGCSSLTDLDLSGFDMQSVTTGFDLYGCDSLLSISVPKKIPDNIEIGLPTTNGTDIWYDKNANMYTKLPTGLSESITLYKNGFTKDESGTLKKVLRISGITLDSKTYDGMPIKLTGTMVAKDMEGNIITDVIINCHYEGTLINGSDIGKTMEAPTQAGQYRLVFTIEENDEYIVESYSFNIEQKEVTITAPTISIEVDENLPEVSELTYSANGFVGKDTFIIEPQIKYDAKNISTSKTGTYEIIPYGAEVGDNYSINYVRGTLFIEESLRIGTTNNITYKLSKDGRLTITGTGDYEVNNEGLPPWSYWSYNSVVVNVSDITSTRKMFFSAHMTSANLLFLDTSKVTDMSYMFARCKNLSSLDLSGFNTGNVTNMKYMFANCAITNLDLSSFDFSNVTNMHGMFLYEAYLSHVAEFGPNETLQSVDLGDFNISKMKDTNWMFYYCTALTSININNADTSNVRSMLGMFYSCTALTSLDLSSFDTSNVKDMQSMFSRCYRLTSLDLSSFDTSNVKNMSYMFVGCNSLTSLDLSSFDTGNVEDMSGMFNVCNSLTSLDLSSFDTGNVEDMSIMFHECNSLTSLDLGSFDTGNVRSMSSMFDGCNSLTSLDLSSFDTGNVEDMQGMIDRCIDLSLMCTPKNCKEDIALPIGNDMDKWYDGNGKVYTELPKNLSDSVPLYKNAYPGDGTGTTEQVLFISGITVNDKVYDKTANPFIGTPVAKDSSGSISDVSISYSYSGKLTNGSTYTKTTEAPTQAGKYKLSFVIDGSDAYLAQSTYSFRIIPKEVIITAKSVSIFKNEQLPAVSELTYTVEGMLDGDALITDPQLKYSAENISTSKSGRYDIIPYGAEAESNYSIKYVHGKLAIVLPEDDPEWGDVLREDRPEDGDIPDGLWITGVEEEGYAYTGSAIKPEVRVYDHTTLLKLKTDYTVSYKNNTKANDASVESKAPTIIVTGKGNYTGKDTKTFKILPLDISPADIGSEDIDSGNEDKLNEFEADDITIVANGKAQKPAPTLLWNGKKLSNKTNYTFTYHEGTYEIADADSGNADANITDTGILNSVKEAGDYYIKLTGVGNFTGTRRIKLTVLSADDTSIKPISKAKVTKIPNQSYQTQYKDGGVTPEVTVKYGSETLTPGTHYTVTYSNNTKVGTAYAVIKGIEKNGYSGTKRVSFKITGIAIKKATVKGLSGQTFLYSGVDFTPDLTLTVKVNGQERTLVPGDDYDYKVAWQNNQNAGKATAVITGLGGYTGTVKKTFKIQKFDVAANAGERFKVTLENDSVPYAKGGAKPALKVTFTKENGEMQTLTEGKDYTLSYKNNTAVNDGSNANKIPTVTIKGKGNFSGTYAAKPTYKITPQEIENLTLLAADKTYQKKKNVYAAKVTITDLNGKILKAGTDYDKTFTYKYISEATLDDETYRAPGDSVGKDDIIPAGTILEVTVSSKGNNYTGAVKGEYRITQASISGATVSVQAQTYTGRAIKLSKEQITVKVKGKKLDLDQYEIVPGSYKNNVKKGTASVTIKGVGDYGGTKTVKFKIGAKGFLLW